jgi:uncharacterized phage protein (TIGR02218 family)
MKQANQALINLLNTSQQFFKADLYTFTLKSGVTSYYSGIDADVVYNGITYTASDLILERTKVKTTLGVEVDTLTIDAYGKDSSSPFFAQCAAGVYDSATLKLDRAFLSGIGGTVVGAVNVFAGQVATIRVSRIKCEMQVKSWTYLLDVMMPRNQYQPTCQHTLYGTGCNVNKSSYTAIGNIVNIVGNNYYTNNQYPDHYYELGYMTFTSGANTGISRTIKQQQGNAFTFTAPFPQPVAVGDNFTIYAGCDKTQPTCQNKFNNLLNFKGFPFIPVPETML